MSVGFVILITLVSGLLDLGRLYYIYIALEDAVGEAALYLSLDPFCLDRDDFRPGDHSDPNTRCTDPNNGLFRASYAVAPDVIDWNKVDVRLIINGVEIDPSGVTPTITVGDEVMVEMDYPVGLLTPVVPKVSGLNPITLRSRATQRVIRVYRDNGSGP